MTLPISTDIFIPEGGSLAVEEIPGLTDDEHALITRLLAKLRRDQKKLAQFNAYYEGVQHLEQLGISIPPELRDFVVIVNWPRVIADSLEHRIDLEGFRLPGETKRDSKLWRIWQANNMDEESQTGHLDAIVYGRSYVCVGTNADDPETPIVTVESPMEMTHEIDRRTRKVRAALRYYRETDENGLQVDRVVVYLADQTIWAEKRWTGTNRGWAVTDRDVHELGRVPVVPLINRSRVSDRDGSSELADVISLTDAAARALTLAQLATEVLSVPQRAVLGASEEDFVGPDGKVLPKWEAYFGAVWALENDKASVHQFAAADLMNFKTIVDHYASMVSSVTGLPLRFFGANTANPPSADGIRADESRLIKSAERRHRAWSGAWEEVARLIKLFVDGDVPDEWVELETIWRNPATPTMAETADATVKLVTAKILPVEAAWEEMGFSQTRIEELRAMRDAEIAANTSTLVGLTNAYRNPAAPTDPNTPGGVQGGSGTPAGPPAPPSTGQAPQVVS